MKVLLTLRELNIDGQDVVKIIKVDALQAVPVSIESDPEDTTVVYEVENDAELNKLLNDYESIEVQVDGAGAFVSIDTSAAGDDVHCRKIPLSDWKVRVRPALMRAATTTNLFNA